MGEFQGKEWLAWERDGWAMGLWGCLCDVMIGRGPVGVVV